MTRKSTEKSIARAREAARASGMHRAKVPGESAGRTHERPHPRAAPVHRYREAILVVNRRCDAPGDRFGYLKRVYD